jgi:Zn-dependent peptidase ImmA (M78 family)/transcriptional regulator with XRE-family HTH domain
MAVNPEMLVLARESRGMSQDDLAAMPDVGITQGKISKYENGMLIVSEEDHDKIAKATNYTPEFFLQKDKIYGLGSSFLFHRKRANAPIAVQKQVQAQVNILRMQVDRLLQGVSLEHHNSFTPLDPDEFNGDIEKIAALTRAAWGLPMGPIANVTHAIESAGGVVLNCGFDTPLIDAAHLWIPGLPPLFFLNRDLPADRARWTLAHEVGHAVMHRSPTSDIEDQANRFAGEFLLPRDEVQPHLIDMTLKKAAMLKPVWKVSMAAIVKRAFDCGAIGESRYRRLFTSLSAEGYRLHEPYPLSEEEPETVRTIVNIYRNDLDYNDFDLAKLLFSPDPQFFDPGQNPAILKLNNKPFFGFITPRRKDTRKVL